MAGIALADGSGDPTAVKEEDGKYLDKDGRSDLQGQRRRNRRLVHLFRLPALSFRMPCLPRPGWRRIDLRAGAENSLKTMSYNDFLGLVASGRKNVNTAQQNVMPAFGANPNVSCYMDDLYVYLRARANDAVPRGRPAKHEPSRTAYTKAERAASDD